MSAVGVTLSSHPCFDVKLMPYPHPAMVKYGVGGLKSDLQFINANSSEGRELELWMQL